MVDFHLVWHLMSSGCEKLYKNLYEEFWDISEFLHEGNAQAEY